MSKKAATKATTALAKHTPKVESMSFNEIMNLDEKELNKQMSFDQKKLGKRTQLQAKIIDCTNKKAKVEQQFRMSLVDPTLDSVELKLEMDCFDKEMEVAFQILNQLFPDEFAAPLK